MVGGFAHVISDVVSQVAHDDVVLHLQQDGLGAEGIRLGFLLGLSLMCLNRNGVA